MEAKKEANTLEGKMNQLTRQLEEKGCFGLKVDCSVCDVCHLTSTCADFAVERLVREELILDKESAAADLEMEMQAAGVIETPEVKIEAPLTVDWNKVVSALLTEKPITIEAAVDCVILSMPVGTTPDFTADSVTSVLQKFAGKGLLTITDASIVWA